MLCRKVDIRRTDSQYDRTSAVQTRGKAQPFNGQCPINILRRFKAIFHPARTWADLTAANRLSQPSDNNDNGNREEDDD